MKSKNKQKRLGLLHKMVESLINDNSKGAEDSFSQYCNTFSKGLILGEKEECEEEMDDKKSKKKDEECEEEMDDKKSKKKDEDEESCNEGENLDKLKGKKHNETGATPGLEKHSNLKGDEIKGDSTKDVPHKENLTGAKPFKSTKMKK